MTSLSVPSIERAVDAAQIALLIPCYNEVVTVADVVKDFQHTLPSALIYVYDTITPPMAPRRRRPPPVRTFEPSRSRRSGRCRSLG
jgi:hypothetical protein